MRKAIIPIALLVMAVPAYMYYENNFNNEEQNLIQANYQPEATDTKIVSSLETEAIKAAEPITNALFGTFAIYNNHMESGSSVLGTGFLIEYQGNNYLVTNQHVVSDNLQTYYIRSYDKFKYEATLIYNNPETDIAFLKMNVSEKLVTLPYESDIKAEYLGTQVYTIGNPYDLLFSISSGVVSNFKKNVVFENGEFQGVVIQTDINVNPGNSGGPLLGPDGVVLGVVSSSLKDANGISFAVPMETVLSELQKIK